MLYHTGADPGFLNREFKITKNREFKITKGVFQLLIMPDNLLPFQDFSDNSP